MYKTITQIAEVAERNVTVNRNAIKEIYPDLIRGRYDTGDGALMKWIQENNPTWDMQAVTKMYEKVTAAIEVQRTALYNQAKKLLDLIREREALIEKFPGYFLISNKKKIEATIVSSEHTQKVFETGREDDIKLFDKD